MKLSASIDKRLVCQSGLLAALTILPVTMALLNGSDAVSALISSTSPASKLSEGEHLSDIVFGCYDPEGVFDQDDNLGIRHAYLGWNQFDSEALTRWLKEWSARGARPLLTVEPWPTEQDAHADDYLLNIVKGKYDTQIDQVIALLDHADSAVYLSWGHEMDQDLTERYPWSGSDPENYVTAYRYVIDRMREKLGDRVRVVWAGVLKQGSHSYWPGDAYVDVIGMPIYSFPAWDRQTYGHIRDFRTTFNEKAAIVRRYNKPLMITELGVCGSSDFESYWLRHAFLDLREIPGIEAVLFFHGAETEGAWGEDMQTPEWRVDPGVIRGLVKWFQSN